MSNFFKSEVMRSYYRVANQKGWVKSEPAVVVKTAAPKDSFEPTESLFQDLCRLADGLRSKGYEKQADALQEKILAYKTAETHLYRVHDEDGDDLIEHAHPEGDAKIEDAQNGEGVVETAVSAHKKMLDVALRNPTGKLAAAALEITKKAQAANNSIDSVINIIGGLNESFTKDMVIDGILQNGGPVYDFLNVYYHDFFTKLIAYRDVAYFVFGDSKFVKLPNHQFSTVHTNLSRNGVEYLNNISQYIEVSDLLDKINNPGFFSNNAGSAATEIVNRFNAKFFAPLNMDANVRVINTELHSFKIETINEFKNAKNNPAQLKNELNKFFTSDAKGEGKYFKMAFDALNGTSTGSFFANTVNSVIQGMPQNVINVSEQDANEKAIERNPSINNALGRFKSVKDKYDAIIKAYPNDTDVAVYKENSQKLSQLISAITNSATTGSVIKSINNLLDGWGVNENVESPTDVDYLSQAWYEDYKSNVA